MKKLTLRERVLLIILIILILISGYFLLFYMPNKSKVENLQSEITQKNKMISQFEEMAENQENMQKQLSYLKSNESNRKPMPYYDNIQNIIFELNKILVNTNKYSINFSVSETEESVVERKVSIPFSCNSYAEVKDVLEQISSGDLPCLIDSVNIYDGSDGEIEAEINIIYFEYNKNTTVTENN